MLLATTLTAALGTAIQSPSPAPADIAAEITVTTPRGRTSGGIDPLLEVSPAELDSYGADSLSDLVDALRPMTRSSRSDQMAVVLINGHLAGQTEFDNLPREAIDRVDVLPESVALQYGFSENQRVLNFVLREHYRALPVRATTSGATEGGSEAQSADASWVRLEEEARVTLLASHKDSAWLRESDRGIDAPDSAYRTLQPRLDDTKAAATVSRSILGVSSSLEASYDVASTRTLQGAAGPGATLDAGQVVRTSRIATQLTGQLDEFIWGTTAYYLHVGSRSSSDTGVDPTGATLIDRTESALNAGNVQFSLSGPIAHLPAGALIANGKLSVQYQGFETRDAAPEALATVGNLVRTIRSANFNASVPIANRSRDVLPQLGELSATLNALLDTVSDFGTLLSTSYGVDWNPLEKLHCNVIYTDHRAAPTVQQLRAPPVVTSNVETFDYLTGQTVYVGELSGGNGALASTDSRQASVGLSIGPFAGKTELLLHYETTSAHNAIGALPPTSSAVELAFPGRFSRGPDGTLLAIDDRWVNLDRARVDDVKWGLNLWVPLGDSPPRSMPERLEVSLFHTWYIHDVTLIRPGIPPLDLLDGAPSDVTGGQPRHKIEFHTLVHRHGLGVLLAAAWHSSTVVDSGDALAPDPIYFSSLTTADLRVFVDFQRLPLTQSRAWAHGARLSVAVTNLFDRREAVHDAAGATPTAFEPGYLDPPGRVLALSVRKVF